MKGRLSAILKKPRKESGKNCQNTAAERRSISFGQPAETAGKNADAEILAAIDEIEFDFGRDRFTTAQAELLFTYEIGLDLDRLYVIALSKNCGTVIFYISDDLKGRIMERAGELGCTAEIDPETVEILWNAIQKAVEILWNAVQEILPAVLLAIEQAEESGHPERKSNNWLKMHGFPMRRKGKGRKHHE